MGLNLLCCVNRRGTTTKFACKSQARENGSRFHFRELYGERRLGRSAVYPNSVAVPVRSLSLCFAPSFPPSHLRVIVLPAPQCRLTLYADTHDNTQMIAEPTSIAVVAMSPLCLGGRLLSGWGRADASAQPTDRLQHPIRIAMVLFSWCVGYGIAGNPT